MPAPDNALFYACVIGANWGVSQGEYVHSSVLAVGGLMPIAQLKAFLDARSVQYTCVSHPPAFTAQELAHHVHITGEQVAKTVIIELDGKMAMVVMPATWRIRWERLSKVLDTDFVELADEDEFRDRFPGCEVGAMPPFGALFGMHVYCAEALTSQRQVVFPAGSHGESILMSMHDYLQLVNPVVISQGFIRPDAPKPEWLRNKPPAPPAMEELGFG